ncbi:retrovirus-related pol polyprotein from transposon TNT 1-94 [Tanacetum coccineum]
MVDGKVDKVPFTSTLVDPTSSNWARPVLTNARLVVEVFDGTGHFGIRQSEVLDALFQQEQRYAFSKETFAYKLWVSLEEKFLEKNCQNKLFMKKRRFRFTYVSGTTMNDHITSFNRLVTDLMNMDEVFKDQDLALILLGSLPKEYELLETTILNGKDDVSLSEVCVALYSKELRRKDKQISSSGDAEVLLVRGRLQKKGTDKRWRSKSRHRLSKDECAFCYEKGHWKKDCPRLKTKDNHYKGKVVMEANVTKCDDEESDLSLATSLSRNASEIWLLDSACSHHITPHRELFSNFEERVEVVYTAKETPLTTHGFEVRAKDGVMKISSGVLAVMKGIRKINNTYHYKGRTVVGTVAAVTEGDRNSEAVLVPAEVVMYACHLVNHLPSTAIDGKTPFEKWYGKPATEYDSLHVFGSATYYHVKESKLDPKAKKALFMGITSGIKGYRLLCPKTKKTVFSRDVTFNEPSMLKAEQLDGTPKKVKFERIILPADREPDDNSPILEGDYEEEEVQAEEPRQQQHESIATSKPKRNTKRHARLNDTVACASSIVAKRPAIVRAGVANIAHCFFRAPNAC